jgi:hypothetical protein
LLRHQADFYNRKRPHSSLDARSGDRQQRAPV